MQFIFASTRLRRWYPLHRHQMARPRCFEARRASLRASAVTQPICSSAGIWPRRSGKMGASPMLLPVLSIRRFSWPAPPRYGILTFSFRRRRHRVLKSGTFQFKPTNRRRLCTNPVVCLSGMPNSAFMVRQDWIAASLKLGCLPRFPVGGGFHTMSGSNQIVSDPRCRSASLYVDQFVVLYFVGVRLLMPSRYHAGFTQLIPPPICATRPMKCGPS